MGSALLFLYFVPPNHAPVQSLNSLLAFPRPTDSTRLSLDPAVQKDTEHSSPVHLPDGRDPNWRLLVCHGEDGRVDGGKREVSVWLLMEWPVGVA